MSLMTFILSAMKKIFVILVLSAIVSGVYGQKSIDALFDRYAGHKGFVTMTIDGDLLKLASMTDDNDDDCHLPKSITGIRLLVREEPGKNDINFYDNVISGIDKREYEEFMRFKKSDQDITMLVRTEGDHIRELLLIGGGKDNILIQIKGDMTYREAKEFSSGVKSKGCFKMTADIN